MNPELEKLRLEIAEKFFYSFMLPIGVNEGDFGHHTYFSFNQDEAICMLELNKPYQNQSTIMFKVVFHPGKSQIKEAFFHDISLVIPKKYQKIA